ncbi:hypothetical protein [Dyadobacter sp.]|uniref:hypothetical protein n=1 Tax=Dyadobacter sp. TaxID=1914288 RepID=UPI003F727E7F
MSTGTQKDPYPSVSTDGRKNGRTFASMHRHARFIFIYSNPIQPFRDQLTSLLQININYDHGGGIDFWVSST